MSCYKGTDDLGNYFVALELLSFKRSWRIKTYTEKEGWTNLNLRMCFCAVPRICESNFPDFLLADSPNIGRYNAKLDSHIGCSIQFSGTLSLWQYTIPYRGVMAKGNSHENSTFCPGFRLPRKRNKGRSLNRCFSTDLDAMFNPTVRIFNWHAVLSSSSLTKGSRSQEITS